MNGSCKKGGMVSRYVPLLGIELGAVIECYGHEPRVGVHRN